MLTSNRCLSLVTASFTGYSYPGQVFSVGCRNDTSTIAPNDAGNSINAFGFNPEDSLGYGIFTGYIQLAQLDAEGMVIPFGAIAGLPPGNYPAGAIADDGLYYAYSPNALNK